ncbi:uncharacterized protein L199_000588 [Kwoniella botswanensis]|uniref:uncharacterized protein n=1 Tax=Kwoniella botswanensis TaxID=1268659 RepID=UPI00315D8676
MSGQKEGPKDPSKGKNNDNSSPAHHPENQGIASKPRTTEDLRALIQNLDIGPTRDAISINTNLPPFTLSTTTNGSHAANNEGSPSPKRPRPFGTPFTPQKPANSKGQSQLPSPDTAMKEKAKMPLPIGAEKKLGLIERTQPQPQYGYPATPGSPSSIWPQYNSGWVETHKSVSPISPKMTMDYRPGYSYYEQYQDGVQVHEEQWDRYQPQRDRKECLYNIHHGQSNPASNLPRRTITFNPFADDTYATTSMNINSSSAKSGSSQPRNGQPISSVEDYNFSDLISTPGFGGFGVTFGTSSYLPAYNGNHQQYQNPASTASNTRPNAAQLTQALSNAGKRSSAYGNKWYAQNDQGQAHQAVHRQRRPSMSHHTRYPSFEGDLVRANTGTLTHTAPTHQFTTPGPERRPNANDSVMVPRKIPWTVTQYTNTGTLPPNWGPGTGLDSGPPPPTPFAPGDWLCAQPYCGYHNFQKNPDCRACGHPRPWEMITHNTINSPPLGSVGDWRCDCGYINWRRRALCKSCYPDHPSNRDRSAVTLSNHPAGDLNTYQSSSTGRNNSKPSNEMNRSNDQVLTIFSSEVSLSAFLGSARPQPEHVLECLCSFLFDHPHHPKNLPNFQSINHSLSTSVRNSTTYTFSTFSFSCFAR